jgi:hypothetical protein
MWSNIVDREFFLNTSVRLATPTTAIPIVPIMVIPNVTSTTIPNVLVSLEPGEHEDIVVEPNVDEAIEEDGN